MKNEIKKLIAAFIFAGMSITPGYCSVYAIQTNPVSAQSTYGVQKTAQDNGKTIFSTEKDTQQQYHQEQKPVEKIKITKNLKQSYKAISNIDVIIEACELLKGGAGDFSYKSVHGTNKTNAPIKIDFIDFSKDILHKTSDAYGMFSGSKYEIKINSKYCDAPAAALAPIIAREALVSKEKTESDLEAAQYLQLAVWTQMLEQNPNLEGSQNPLVQAQNKLLGEGSFQDYGAFLNQSQTPKTYSKDKRSLGKGAPTQVDFDVQKKAEGEKVKAEVLSFDSAALQKKYKKITKEDRIIEALELLKDTVGKFSHDAIMGYNITHKPIAIKFKNLSEIKQEYATFDALGWRQAGKLNIYINSKHVDAPAAALAAILSHEALHQDEFDSLNEETYAWTMEASVWTQLCDKDKNVGDITHPLVARENILKKLLEKGNYTNKYIKKSVFSNPSYSKLPVRSPGFEDDI